MKTVFCFFASLFVFIGCSLTPRPGIQFLEVRSFGEAYIPGQKTIAVLEQRTKIVISGEYILYIKPFVKTRSKLSFDKDGNVAGQKEVSRDTTFNIFASKKNKEKGLKYTLDNFRNEQGQIINIDSMLNANGFGDDVYSTFDYNLGNPDSVVKNGKKRVEKYFIRKQSYAEPDSIYRYYDDALTDIRFSFSKRLDKEHKSKLYKTVFVMNKIPKNVVLPDTEIPRRESWNDLRRIDEKNPALFLEIIEKFKRDYKSQGLDKQTTKTGITKYGIE